MNVVIPGSPDNQSPDWLVITRTASDSDTAIFASEVSIMIDDEIVETCRSIAEAANKYTKLDPRTVGRRMNSHGGIHKFGNVTMVFSTRRK